jgi:RimJ/RimL family protein N-acetyltransferase
MAEWDGATVLTTDRLLLRRWRDEDLDPWAELNSDPEVVRHLGGRPLPRADSDAIAQWHNDVHGTEGIGLLAVERRLDGEFLGMCGLHHQETFPDDVEVAWRLASQHWHQGYATEAATAWLDHAFAPRGPLRLERVISMTDKPNVASLAVMGRLGLTFDHEARVVDEGETFDAVVYSITAETWLARRG